MKSSEEFVSAVYEKAEKRIALRKRRRISCVRYSVCAACMLIIVTVSLNVKKPPEPNTNISYVPTVSDSGTATTSDAGATSEVSGIPGYIPPFSQPTLEEIYSIEPFGNLMPRYFPEVMSFADSYKCEPDLEHPELGIKGRDFLRIHFDIENSDWGLSLDISDDISNYTFADLSTQTGFEEYSLKYFYEYLKKEDFEKSLTFFLKVFRPEDITEELVAARTYTYPDGLYTVSISMICDNMLVSYSYNSYTSVIPADELYKMITSSDYFAQLRKR